MALYAAFLRPQAQAPSSTSKPAALVYQQTNSCRDGYDWSAHSDEALKNHVNQALMAEVGSMKRKLLEIVCGRNISEDVRDFVLRECDSEDSCEDNDVNEIGDEGYLYFLSDINTRDFVCNDNFHWVSDDEKKTSKSNDHQHNQNYFLYSPPRNSQKTVSPKNLRACFICNDVIHIAFDCLFNPLNIKQKNNVLKKEASSSSSSFDSKVNDDDHRVELSKYFVDPISIVPSHVESEVSKPFKPNSARSSSSADTDVEDLHDVPMTYLAASDLPYVNASNL
ncbi:hypothetical protein L1987_15346 [Smallanthus sonchifolius]|uniref:Uncharacterized protein n=1 Tax=Smallanthus sonchifolius TaxID=185202 RepID=A0ACB9J8T3_9ASTR|nr:hypothetical protein L1987_15346 [Smallanthus sonchifolius]